MTKKKATLSFDFEALDGSDEVTAQTQSLHALRIIGLVQMGYVIIGYATGIISLVTESQDLSQAILQAPGGISILSAVAALLIRLDCRAQQSKTQLLAYISLVSLDLLGWVLRIILTLYSTALNNSISHARAIITYSPFGFVLVLSILGILEAKTLKSLVETTRYAPLSVSSSTSDAEEKRGMDRGFTELCYYPLRRVCVLQLAYCLLFGYFRVIGAYILHSMGMLEFLVNPGLGLLTPVAVVFVLNYCFPPPKLNILYSILIGLDATTGLIRLALGFMFSTSLYTSTSETRNVYFVSATLWSLFIFYLWGIGIYESQKVRRRLADRSIFGDQVDHIFSL